MPQFAANLMYLFNELPFLERFEAARRAGFRLVEYQYPYTEDLSATRDALAEFGLDMVLINTPPGDLASGDRGLGAVPGREAEFRDGFLQALAYARELSCPRVHVMAGVVPDGEAEMAMAVFADNLRMAARTAEAAGIGIVIEPINGVDVPGYLLQRTAQARALLAMVGETNIGLQYDAYHALMNGEDPIEGLRANFDIIHHMQVAGFPGRGEPGTGSYDMRAFFEVCDMMGYTGAIGCEYRPTGLSTEAGLGWASIYGIGGD